MRPNRLSESILKPLAALLLFLGLLMVQGGSAPLLAEPNPFEKERIEAQALAAFKVIIGLWREELYFELYEFGMESTRNRIKRDQFAQRMVELSWVPKGKLNPKYLKTRFHYRTMIYVDARVEYRHKFNPSETFSKDHTFLLMEEDGIWRIDLVKLVRAPFA